MESSALFDVRPSPLDDELRVLTDYYKANFYKNSESWEFKDSKICKEAKELCLQSIRIDLKSIEIAIDGLIQGQGDTTISIDFIPKGCTVTQICRKNVVILEEDASEYERHFHKVKSHPSVEEVFNKISVVRTRLSELLCYKTFFRSLDGVSEKKMKSDIIHGCCRSVCQNLCEELISLSGYMDLYDIVEKCLEGTIEIDSWDFRKVIGLLGVAHNFNQHSKPILSKQFFITEEVSWLVSGFINKLVLVEETR